MQDKQQLIDTSNRDIASTSIQDDIEYSIEGHETILPDYELPRPSYYSLQLLGMWLPSNATFACNLYHRVLIPVLWIFSVIGVFGRGFIDYSNFRWGRLMNSSSNIISLGAPYILCRYYFNFGCYCEFVSKAMLEDRETVMKIQRLSKFYSFLSLLFWIFSFFFYFFHYKSTMLLNDFYLVSYIAIILLCTGWWSVWLSFYGFICSVLKIQIQHFLEIMKKNYGYSTRTKAAEENCIQDLLRKFTIIRDNINQSQKDFEKIITFSVICCLVDIVIFSIAYWKHDFSEFPISQYVMGILVEFFSIMFKLYPAAIVNQTLHEIVRVAGEHCYPDIDVGETPKQRFVFYQFLFIREQDLGLHILGLKITSKLTVGLLVTIGTVGLTFLHYVVPFLNDVTSL